MMTRTIRSSPGWRGAVLAAGLWVLCGVPAGADEPSHGIAMHGEPALGPDFTHLPYANPDAPKGGRLRIGFQGTFDSLNPFNIKSGSTAQGLNGNVFQTLMARNFDEPFSLYGLIAKSIETDPDRTHVTFHLDPRARFADGTPITADDVRFTFDLLRTKGRPQARGAYGQVQSVETPDAETVRYDLTGSQDRELPLILALMPVLSRRHTDLERFQDSSLEIPTGSGPYVISEVEPGQRLVLKRNPDYWARDVPAARGLYNFDEIVIEYYRDATALYEAFKAGLIDYREETNPSRWLNGYDFPAMHDGRTKRAAVHMGIPKGLQGFAFNTRRAIFQDVRVREALSLMFDFDWINANLFGGLYTRTKSFFDDSELSSTGRPANAHERSMLAPWPGAVRPDIMEGKWTPPKSDGSGRDRKLARRAVGLLRDAGFAITDGVMRRATTGAPLSFEIMVGDRAQERLALNYAGSLARIGVEVRVRLVDDVQYQRRRQKFDFDMMIGTWLASASPGNEQRSRWGSASAHQEASFNLAGAAAPAIDGMIDHILAARSHEDFVDAVRAYDRVLLSGFYVVPLFHAADQWFAWSTRFDRPQAVARYAAPLFGATLDTWWRKSK
jgi:peptide/nickel transport system substrate-binding protein